MQKAEQINLLGFCYAYIKERLTQKSHFLSPKKWR